MLPLFAVGSGGAATAGLVAAYSFNEGSGTTVGDASGTGNNGTTSNTTWSASGRYGGALSFNGTTSRVNVPNSSSLQLTSAMTLEAWVNPNATTSKWRDVIYKGNDNYYLEATSSNSSKPAGGGTFGGTNANVYGAAAPTANTWSYLALTYDGTTLRLYVNGTLVGSQAKTGAITTSTNQLQIGGDSLYSQYFSGLIDEVRVYNIALSAAAVQTDMNTPIAASGDTTPPSAPGTLSASVVNAGEIDLSWGAATDNVGVIGYRVYRCLGAGCSSYALLASPAGSATTFKDTSVAASSSYGYEVRAVDAAGNLGAFSNAVAAATPAPPDTTPPTAPGTLTGTVVGSGEIDLGWGAATDNVGVTGYQVFRCQGAGCNNYALLTQPVGTPTTFHDISVSAGTTYGYEVRAVDAAGNLGPFSNTITATTQGAPDTTPPSKPGTLSSNAVSAGEIDLLWASATDNVGVTGYEIFRCTGSLCAAFAKVGQTGGGTTSYNDSGLTAATSYSYEVRALDAAGNLGPFSNVASALTGQANSSGLVAAYGFNEGTGTTVADASGNGNVGSIVNAAWTASGKYGGALSFNGTNARVDIPNSPSLQLGSGMTLEAWVDPSATNSIWRDVIYKGTDNYYLEGTSASVGDPAGGGTFSGANANAFGSSPLTANAWSYLALTYDNATLRLYVNGTLTGSQARTGAMASSTNPLQIGGDSLFGQYFSGLIDEVRVYNVPLAVTAIQADMASAVNSGGADTQPPTTPTNLAVGAIAQSSLTLTWAGSTDNVGVTGYQLFRDGVKVGTSSSTSFSFSSLSCNTTYTLGVAAVDAATNISGTASTTARTAACSDTTPPSTPGTLSATAAAAAEIDLTWGASTDNVGVTGYEVFRCQGAGCTTFTLLTQTAVTTYQDTTVSPASSYSYEARALDGGGNRSPFSNAATATTPASTDTTPPSAPGPLSSAVISPTEIDLSWGAATDNVGVTGYRIDRCQGAGCTDFSHLVQLAGSGTSYKDTTVAAATTYSYQVRALDAAGNLGPYSNVATATTQSPPSPRLVAAYSFDDGTGTTVADASGNGNNGTIVERYLVDVRGDSDPRSRSTGTVTSTSRTRPSLQLTTGMTLEAWVNPVVYREQLARRDLQGQRQLLPRSDPTTAGSQPAAGRSAVRTLTSLAPCAPDRNVEYLALTYDGANLRLYVERVSRLDDSRHRGDRDVDEPAADRRRQPLRPVLQRPDRRGPHLQRSSHRSARSNADMGTSVGGINAPSAPTNLTASRSQRVGGRSQLESVARDARVSPATASSGARGRAASLRADRNLDESRVQRHRVCRSRRRTHTASGRRTQPERSGRTRTLPPPSPGSGEPRDRLR